MASDFGCSIFGLLIQPSGMHLGIIFWRKLRKLLIQSSHLSPHHDFCSFQPQASLNFALLATAFPYCFESKHNTDEQIGATPTSTKGGSKPAATVSGSSSATATGKSGKSEGMGLRIYGPAIFAQVVGAGFAVALL